MSDETKVLKILLQFFKQDNLELAKKFNSGFLKARFRQYIEIQKLLLSNMIEDAECKYKEFDEQLDEKQLEEKNLLREIIDLNLFFKKFYEDELGKEETI